MFFKTLKSEINKQLNDTIYKNDIYLKYKYKFPESTIIKWSKFPFIQSLKFTLFFLLLGFIFYQFNGLDYALPPFPLKSEHWVEIIKLNDLIFSGQLTIIGLIFPLVIGFVGILIKDDTANKSLWRIYSRYSGFLLVGFSSLFLIILMSLLKYFTPFTSNSLEVSFALSIATWFIFNIFLVVWLIHSTFNFIRLEKRSEVILKYATNIIIIREIKKRLFSLISTSEVAQKLNLLPKDFEEENLEVTHFSWKDESKYSVKKSFSQNKYLININFTLLTLFIKSLLFRNTYFLVRKGTKLILPTTGSDFPYSKYTLSKMNNIDFSLIDKLIISQSYNFSKNSLFEDDDVQNIVNSFFNNMENYIKESNPRLFEDSTDKLQEFMQTIFGITAFTNDEKQIDNWLLLSDNTMFSRTLLNELMREFYSLNRIIINKTKDSEEYFRKFCSFYQYSFRENNNTKIHSNIQKSLMEAHLDLWSQLVSNTYLKNIDNFNDLCKIYIGGWESWSNRKERDISNWKIAQHASKNLINNLLITNDFIQVSLKYKNDKAVLWAINMLNNWYDNYFSFSHSNYQYLWKTDILSFNIFAKYENEDNEVTKFIVNNQSFENNNIESLYKILCNNIWIHSRIINSAYILNKDLASISEIDRKTIFGLINGHKLSPETSSNMVFNNSYEIVQKILGTYILNEYAFNSITGNGLAYNLTASFDRIYEDTRISGRVYSGGGREGISRLKETMITLMLSNSTNTFDLSSDIYDFVFSDNFEQGNVDSLIREINELVNINDTIKEKTKNLLGKDDIDNLVNNYNASLTIIINKIKNKNNENLSQVEISDERLKVIKSYCSSSAFHKETLKTPLFLFQNVVYDENLEENPQYKHLIDLHNVNKRDLISAKVNRSVNEDEFYSSMLNEQFKIKVFRDLFKVINTNCYTSEYTNEKSLIMNMLSDSKNIENAIILIGSNAIISFIYKLRWDKNEEISFTIDFQQNDESDYICHINDIPVYRIDYFDIDYCLLFEKNILKEITIKKFDNETFVNLEYQENKGCLEKGLLKISFFIKTYFLQTNNCFKYSFKRMERT